MEVTMAKKLEHASDPQLRERVTLKREDVGSLDAVILGGDQPPDAVRTIRAIERRCRGPLAEGAQETISKLLADGQLDEARALDAASRKGGGQDWDEGVLQNP